MKLNIIQIIATNIIHKIKYNVYIIIIIILLLLLLSYYDII